MKKIAVMEIKPIMEKLNSRRGSNIKDAYICDREIFELVYQLEKKRNKRSKSNAFVVSLKVIGEGLAVEEMDKTAIRILDVFKKRLRSNDIVCKLDKNNFVLLINNIIYEELIQRLTVRINYFFYSLSNINHRKSWIDIFNRTGLIWDYKPIQYHSS